RRRVCRRHRLHQPDQRVFARSPGDHAGRRSTLSDVSGRGWNSAAQYLGAAFATGAFNRVPVISGTNHDEYRLFVADDYDFLGNPLTNAEYTTAVDTLWGTTLGPIVLDDYPLSANPPADAASLAL